MGLLSFLNPRVILVASIVLFVGFLFLKISWQKTTIATQESKIAVLTLERDNALQTIDGLGRAVEALKTNLSAAKQSLKEMQSIRAEANDLRRKLLELQNEPQTCEFLKVEYEKIAGDITTMFNSGVRRKISRPDPYGDRAAPEVLPSTTPPTTG